jgi:hypothetical protein
MQTKPQVTNAKAKTPNPQTNKSELFKQPQPLNLKAMQQVGGGRKLPGGNW